MNVQADPVCFTLIVQNNLAPVLQIHFATATSSSLQQTFGDLPVLSFFLSVDRKRDAVGLAVITIIKSLFILSFSFFPFTFQLRHHHHFKVLSNN